MQREAELANAGVVAPVLVPGGVLIIAFQEQRCCAFPMASKIDGLGNV